MYLKNLLENIFKRYFLAFFVSSFMIMGSGCANNVKEYKETRSVLFTFVTIHCFYEKGIDIDVAVAECWKKLDEINFHMNPYAEDGDLARLNNAGSGGAIVNEDLFRLIKKAVKFYPRTKRAMNITIFPLVRLWEMAASRGTPPSTSELEGARELADPNGIRFDETSRRIYLQVGMKIDTGAMVKGFAMDEVAHILDRYGIESFMVNAGGDLFCRGMRARGRSWRIGIQDPLHKDRVVDILKLDDRAVATSGDYEKYFTVGKKKYSHIIDPSTGYPAKQTSSATVVAKSALLADVYATTLSVLGGAKGIEFIESLRDDTQAMVIEKADNKVRVFSTSGYRRYQVTR